jgi:hypothetical protein
MAFISTSTFKDLLNQFRGSLGGADDTDILRFANFLNQYAHEAIANVNPNDFLQVRTIKTVASTGAYALPSDFDHVQYGGVYYAETGTDFVVINYDTETGAFTEGLTVTGGTSGATGVITELVDYGTTGTLRLSGVTGTFEDNETITDTSTGSAIVNGSQSAVKFGNRKLSETEFGSQSTGYWLDASNVNLTPTPVNSSVFFVRYLPTLSQLTSIASDQYLVIPANKYNEFVTYAAELYWQQWRNAPDEVVAGERVKSALQKMLSRIKKTPGVMKFTRRDALYTTVNNSVRFYQN